MVLPDFLLTISEDHNRLFRQLALGWSMALVGGIVCQLFFGYR